MTIIRSVSVSLALALLTAVVAGPALGDDLPPDPFAAYAVAPGAATDTLTIREQAGEDNGAVGTLDPAAPVVVTGVRVELDGPPWWQIIRPGGGRGWVPASALVRVDGDAAPATGFPLLCVGTEPFWSVNLDGAEAVFREMGSETEASFAASTWIPVVGRIGHVIVRLHSGAASGVLAASQAFDGCSDGMSEFIYPLSGTLLTPGGSAYVGCCARNG